MNPLLSLVSSLIKPKEIEFVRVENVKFESRDNGILPLNVTLVLKNPNHIGVQVDSIACEISCWNAVLAETQQELDLEIVANDTFRLPLRLLLNLSVLKEKLKNDFLNILSDEKITVPVTLNGKAILRKFGFSFDFPVNYARGMDITLDQILEKIKL